MSIFRRLYADLSPEEQASERWLPALLALAGIAFSAIWVLTP